MSQVDNIITAKEYSLRDILQNEKYSVDFFQREYNWKKENIIQLVYDLINAFTENYKEGDIPESVMNYNAYYMGPIVLYDNKGKHSIIDGQQRITSLTLLLIFLKHKTKDIMDDFPKDMIFSSSLGKKSFNIDIPERTKCIEGLYNNDGYEPKEEDDASVMNMVDRYRDIEESFPEDIKNDELILFVYWLMERVILVKITAMSDKNAYMIFETMNDRGLSLTSTDMLKGFILSKYNDVKKRSERETKWKKDMIDLSTFDKSADSQFFQAWLRAQFAQTIRSGKANTSNKDFETIGERFHYWFRENYDKDLLNIAINNDIENFMDNNYDFYLKYFLEIKNAETIFTQKLQHVYYTKVWGFAESLKYPLLLAPLSPLDSENVCIEKIDIVSKFIDSFCVRRAVNFRSFGASSLRYTMSNLTKTIRNLSIDELKEALQQTIDNDKDDYKDNSFNNLTSFRMHQKNKNFIKYFLARITSFVETGSNMPNNFEIYMKNPNCKPYEIEHIWSDKIEYHADEFDQENEFEDYRNKIGALILLPNGSNQSYGELPYKEKMPHYIKENILAKSFCAETYEHNPNFLNFIKSSGLPFINHTDFKKDDILKRCELYKDICEILWGNV